MQIPIWQQKEWPYLTWNNRELSYVLGEVRNRQGRLAGKAELIGRDLKFEAVTAAVTKELIASAALDDRTADEAAVSASVAQLLTRQELGEASPGEMSAADGMARMMGDALFNSNQPITIARLERWNGWLMQPADGEPRSFSPPTITDPLLMAEMQRFMGWLNTAHGIDPVIKAGVAHLRVLLVAPFEHHNGMIARALADVFLTRADDSPQRLFSLSAQLYDQRESYAHAFRQTAKLEITEWLMWYLYCLDKALITAETALTRILEKSKFWEKYRLMRLNDRQVKMINLLWEGIDHRLTTTYWAELNRCSPDSALRDIQDLIAKKILHKKRGGGRSTSYGLN